MSIGISRIPLGFESKKLFRLSLNQRVLSPVNTVDGLADPSQTSLFFLNNMWLGVVMLKVNFPPKKAVINEFFLFR